MSSLFKNNRRRLALKFLPGAPQVDECKQRRGSRQHSQDSRRERRRLRLWLRLCGSGRDIWQLQQRDNLKKQKQFKRNKRRIFRQKYDGTNRKNGSGVKEETLFPLQRPQSQFELDFSVSVVDSAESSRQRKGKPPTFFWTHSSTSSPAVLNSSTTCLCSRPASSIPLICNAGGIRVNHRSEPVGTEAPATFTSGETASGPRAHRQDLVPLLQPAVQSCSSILFDFGHINARVILQKLLVNTSNYVESQTWKRWETIQRQLRGILLIRCAVK